ncbi:MAG TPA: serpin family protein [Verrucomicrobiae bacterium]|jgi:serpin B
MRTLSRHWLSTIIAALLLVKTALTFNCQAEPTPLVSGNNSFAFDLYSHLNGQPGNLFFSPFSISMCLGMTYAGSRDNTETQMRVALHFPDLPNATSPAFATLQQQLDEEKKRDGIQLDIANALWASRGDSFLPAFMKSAADDFQANIKRAGFFTSAESARVEINNWVAGKTHDKIGEILPPGSLDKETKLVLVNAIYFNARWANPFQKINTSPQPFHLSATTQTNAVFIRKTESALYGASGDMQIVEIPYAGKEISMMILLPSQHEEIAGIEKQLSADNLENWANELRPSQVQIELPKFTLESHFKLRETLAGMGMSEAFSPAAANFSGMDGVGNLYISQVFHQAWVEVSEEGTEAAAATAVQMRPRGMRHPQNAVFRADRPFLFLIRDRTSGTVLFMGRVADPTLR